MNTCPLYSVNCNMALFLLMTTRREISETRKLVMMSAGLCSQLGFGLRVRALAVVGGAY